VEKLSVWEMNTVCKHNNLTAYSTKGQVCSHKSRTGDWGWGLREHTQSLEHY